jgi:peptidyl-prolyl cis-trans isomerase C
MSNKITAAHILVKSEDKAKEILTKLKLGKSFEDLAKENSLCPSKKRGGSLGSFSRGQMVREFENAAFKLKKGEISLPIKTQFGWHLIKRIS